MALIIKAHHLIGFSLLYFAGIFGIGLFFDLVNASYFIIPLVLYLWMMPSKLYSKKWHRFFLYGLFFIFIYILLFNAVSEWFFWDEFNSRYNFIAVDYLIYTTEVIGNIRQSYPVEYIIAAVFLIDIFIIYLIKPAIKLSQVEFVRFKKRSLQALMLLVLPVLSFFLVKSSYKNFSDNAAVNELSGNGIYELFAAYRNNELDYQRFYATIDDKKAFTELRQLVKTPESKFTSDGNGIERTITNAGPEKKMNVILISVESLSAEYLGIFGNAKGITPQLDSLSQHCMTFMKLYATGTRTVRGLEALSLCVPPTPGQSIVRRPMNENLFSLSTVFNKKGYVSNYFYGGYGFFDNMNYFFSNNGYGVIDRSYLKDNEIDYENVWGVADENLFSLVQRETGKIYKSGKPFFAHVMTTSNHRPFTYPEGRINIPSKTNRDGAVKYTDYAIAKFIADAKKEPWFSNTVFVIVADHCASSAGKTELPVENYHIPLFIYSPGNIQPGRIDRLMSQIDIGPTLLGLLNFSYTSKFYGYDLFKLENGKERVFISTYEKLGYIKNDKMIILSPNKEVETYFVNFKKDSLTKTANDKVLLNEAIAWYQCASYSFKRGLMKSF